MDKAGLSGVNTCKPRVSVMLWLPQRSIVDTGGAEHLEKAQLGLGRNESVKGPYLQELPVIAVA